MCLPIWSPDVTAALGDLKVLRGVTKVVREDQWGGLLALVLLCLYMFPGKLEWQRALATQHVCGVPSQHECHIPFPVWWTGIPSNWIKVNTPSYNFPLLSDSHQNKGQRICYRTLLNIVYTTFPPALARHWGLFFFPSFIAINLKWWIKMPPSYTASYTMLIWAQTGMLYPKHTF